MADLIDDQKIRDLQREYLDFLDDDGQANHYTQLINEMIKLDKVRLIVNINDLRKKNPVRCQSLLENSFDELYAFECALKDLVTRKDQAFSFSKHDFFIGLEGSFGAKHLTPRSLVSRFLGQMVCIEGIVTRCSLVRSKVVKSVHYCPSTNKFLERKYTDFTSHSAFPSSSVYPTKDEEGNILETEYGLSIYKDHQTFTIQEMPEKAPAGQIPRAVEIIADNDLSDTCKPGDRVQIVGVYRCLPAKQKNYTNGTFRTILLANNVKLMTKEVSIEISSEDVQKCKRFSRQKNQDVFEILARSIAPTIHGLEMEKKAILCMLLGGVEKLLPTGTRLRGDINVLLIGDPSVAKSQLLRYVLHAAPLSLNSTGRSSSGVGLTASVISDTDGTRRLEAGISVLADLGIACIEEFDKISDIHRSAIHDVMEQGTVTISKAGINARLNARCSVLAAANPVYGRYDEYKTPMENIGLQDSLLSRFDVIFIMLDKNDEEIDNKIADHILKVHRYRNPREQDGEPLSLNANADFLTTANIDETDEKSSTQIYEKFDALLHANRSRSDKIVSIDFMRKYIHLAKATKPKLTKEACDYIVAQYTELRNIDLTQSELKRTQAVTARALETMIRLATAHAKARLSIKVELEDAEEAMEMIHFAYFKKVLQKPKKSKKSTHGLDEDEMEDFDDDDRFELNEENEEEMQEERKSVKRTARQRSTDDEQAADEERQPKKQKEDEEEEMAEIDDGSFAQFKTILFKEFNKNHAQSLSMDDIMKANESAANLSLGQVKACLTKLQDQNHVMVSDNMVFLI